MVYSFEIDPEIKKKMLNSKNSKYTLQDWHYNNYMRFNCCKAQQELARRVINKLHNVCETADEKVKINRDETNHCLEEKINQIEFYKEKLTCNKKDLMLNLDELIVYKNRLLEYLSILRTNALDVCKKCLLAREERLGIDLVNDNVERELLKECEIIKCADHLMSELLEQIEERIRCTKSVLYTLERDIKNKENNLQIDRHNFTLNETNRDLSIHNEKTLLDCSNITMEEWEVQTKNNIDTSNKELQTIKKVCSHTNGALKQITTNLINQKNITDEAFKSQIKETKEVKEKLELQHTEIICQSQEIISKITHLEKSIFEKESFIALAYTRLGNRCQRPSSECSVDEVEKSLTNEIYDLKQIVAQLQQTLFEAQASRRFLLKTQIQIEEDLNIKNNTIKIDETCCLTMHENIKYYKF